LLQNLHHLLEVFAEQALNLRAIKDVTLPLELILDHFAGFVHPLASKAGGKRHDEERRLHFGTHADQAADDLADHVIDPRPLLALAAYRYRGSDPELAVVEEAVHANEIEPVVWPIR
jgi:hypothetical protein